MGKRVCLKNFIRFCDIFGILVTFRINNKIKYRSIDGGIATIIFLIYSIFFAIYLGIPFIKRKNIDFIYSNKIVQSQPYINLTDSNFSLAFGIQYPINLSSAINDFEKYFNYSMILKEVIEKTSIKNYPIELKYCLLSDFNGIINSSFYMNNIDKMFCPVLNNSLNFTLDGLLTDNYYKYIQIEIHLTEYGMNNLEELRNILQKYPIEMTLFFIDTGIDYQNRKNPLPSFINYINKGLDLYFLKTTEIDFSTIEFTNDEHLIFNDGKKRIDSTFDKNEDSFHYINSREEINETTVGKIIIKASSKVIILSRKYQKLPSFVGQLSGVIEQAYLIIFLIVTFIERQAIENKLIHHMFKMKGSKIYDMDYYLNIFHKEKINNDVMNLIKKFDFQIEKTTQGTISRRKSQMILLNNHKIKSLFFDKNENPDTNSIIKNENENENTLNKSSSRKAINNKDNNFEIIKEKPSIIQEEKLSVKSENINARRLSNLPNKNTTNDIDETNNNLSNINEKVNIKEEKKLKAYEKAEKDFPSTSVLSIFFTYLCRCTCDYQRRKYQLISKANGKINYYLEIVNYVKGMQEIDLFKYCLFDKEQIFILDYLAKPPFRINNKEINCIYNEFEKDQYTFKSIGKKEIDSVYNSYNKIRKKEDVTFEDLKLLRLINAEVEYLS